MGTKDINNNTKVVLKIRKLYSIGSNIIKITRYKKPYYEFVYIKGRIYKFSQDFHEASAFAYDLQKIPKIKAKLYD